MMNRKPIFEYRLRSVFFRTLFSLLALMLVMMTAFFFFSSGIISSSVSEQNSNTNKNLLSKTSDVVDISLKFLEDMIQRLTKDKNIISAIVVPNVNRTDRSFAIQNLLKATSSSNNLIQGLYFYSPYDSAIYSSNQQIFQLANFPDPGIVELCAAYTSIIIVNVKNITTHFYNLGGTVYMLRDFPLTGEKRMGTIILKLDSNVFYSLIQGETIINSPITVFDKNGIRVFSDARDYSSGSFPDNVEHLLHSGQENITIYDSAFFIMTSNNYGWTYVYEDRSDISALKVKNLLKTVFPILLVLFALSIILSIYISKYIYKPIRNLLLSVLDSSVSHYSNEKRKFHNEVEYLSSSFSQAILENDELSNTLDGIVPEMEGRLIMDVLLGRNSSNDAAKEYLEHINSKLRGNGQFVMLAVLLINSNNYTVNEIETKIYSICINNAIRQVDSTNFDVRVVVVENGIWAVFLKFNTMLSQEAIKSHISAFMQAIHGSIRQSNFYVQVGVGRVKDSFIDIFNSYKEALRSINFTKYLYTSQNEDNNQRTMEHAALDQDQIKAQIKHITADAAAGDADSALIKIRNIIDGISQSNNTMPELAFAFRAFLDIMYGIHLQYGMTDNDLIFVDAGENIDFESIQDPEKMTERVEAVCSQHISILCKYFCKRQNKLIFQAQKYIDENYSNGSLSLNEVAEHLRVNASYLSTLFSTVLQTRYIDYLNIRRVEKAKMHLAEKDMSIKQITSQDGFNSVQNFMRVFKRFVGLSPGQYREKLAQK